MDSEAMDAKAAVYFDYSGLTNEQKDEITAILDKTACELYWITKHDGSIAGESFTTGTISSFDEVPTPSSDYDENTSVDTLSSTATKCQPESVPSQGSDGITISLTSNPVLMKNCLQNLQADIQVCDNISNSTSSNCITNVANQVPAALTSADIVGNRANIDNSATKLYAKQYERRNKKKRPPGYYDDEYKKNLAEGEDHTDLAGMFSGNPQSAQDLNAAAICALQATTIPGLPSANNILVAHPSHFGNHLISQNTVSTVQAHNLFISSSVMPTHSIAISASGIVPPYGSYQPATGIPVPPMFGTVPRGNFQPAVPVVSVPGTGIGHFSPGPVATTLHPMPSVVRFPVHPVPTHLGSSHRAGLHISSPIKHATGQNVLTRGNCGTYTDQAPAIVLDGRETISLVQSETDSNISGTQGSSSSANTNLPGVQFSNKTIEHTENVLDKSDKQDCSESAQSVPADGTLLKPEEPHEDVTCVENQTELSFLSESLIPTTLPLVEPDAAVKPGIVSSAEDCVEVSTSADNCTATNSVTVPSNNDVAQIDLDTHQLEAASLPIQKPTAAADKNVQHKDNELDDVESKNDSCNTGDSEVSGSQTAGSAGATVWGTRINWAAKFQGKSKGIVIPVDSTNLPNVSPKTHQKSGAVIKDNLAVQDTHKGNKALGDVLKTLKINHRSLALHPRGLINRGNWCYVNSTLQALLACPPFYHMLKSLSDEIARGTSCRIKTPVLNSLVDFINQFDVVEYRLLQTQKKLKEIEPLEPFEPDGVYRALAKIKSESDAAFKGGKQEDAEEFLGLILNGLHEEMVSLMEETTKRDQSLANGDINNQDYNPAAIGCSDTQHDDGSEWEQVHRRNKSITRTAEFKKSPVSEIFVGQMRSALRQTGQKESAMLQPFFTLQLDIQGEKVWNVKQALERFVSKETLEGFTSTKTNMEVEANRRTTLETLPPVLILHLKYFIYDKNGGCQKLTQKKIDYTIEMEIGTNLLSHGVGTKLHAGQRTYKLFAVVYHHGKQAAGGHYTTDFYHPGINGWIRADDSNLTPIKNGQVLNSNLPVVPYLLYYRRCDLMVMAPMH